MSQLCQQSRQFFYYYTLQVVLFAWHEYAPLIRSYVVRNQGAQTDVSPALSLPVKHNPVLA